MGTLPALNTPAPAKSTLRHPLLYQERVYLVVQNQKLIRLLFFHNRDQIHEGVLDFVGVVG